MFAGGRNVNLVHQEHIENKEAKRASMLEERQGYLMKKATKSMFGVSRWQKRYFVLSRGKLLCFASQDDYEVTLTKKKERAVSVSFQSKIARAAPWPLK